MSAQERAEVFFIVLKRLIKWAILGVFALVLIFVGLIYFQEFVEYYKVGRHKERVLLTVSVNTVRCDEEAFLLFDIKNNSSKTIEYISAQVDVTRAGHSTKLNDWSSFEFDKILKPGESVSYCSGARSVEYLPSSLQRKLLKGSGLEASLATFDVRFRDH